MEGNRMGRVSKERDGSAGRNRNLGWERGEGNGEDGMK